VLELKVNCYVKAFWATLKGGADRSLKMWLAQQKGVCESCGRQLRQSSLLGYGQTGSQHIKGNHNIYVRLTRHSAGEMVETNHWQLAQQPHICGALHCSHFLNFFFCLHVSRHLFFPFIAEEFATINQKVFVFCLSLSSHELSRRHIKLPKKWQK